LSHAPAFLFSHPFPGTVWNTLAVESENWLILEVRDDVNFKVTFSLLDYATNEFRWKDVALPESWWVSLVTADKSTVLLNRYINKGNPDHKSLIALDVASATIRWEVEAFSFFDWDESVVLGYRTKDDLVPAKIDLITGQVSEGAWEPTDGRAQPESFKPAFYPEGTAHFETVKKFVAKADYSIVKGVEYLEFKDWILLSIYINQSGNLDNYLLVFDREGVLRLTVKLGEKLAGLGADTFFILSGCLFLVQNKTELVAYRL
jgi:Domain of unknown function (DUF4905)